MGLRKQIRTTISLPEASFNAAKRVARSRHVNLGTVVAEALDAAMKERAAQARAEEILASYREAFQGFSPEELMILDGIMLEKPR